MSEERTIRVILPDHGVGEHLVRATVVDEGDGVLRFTSWEIEE